MFKYLRAVQSRKGFTLIEMLVVVGIVAILVAIVVPVTTISTKKAAAATDAANLRSAIAEASIYALLNNVDTDDYVFTEDEVSFVGTVSKQNPDCTMYLYILYGQPDAYFINSAGTSVIWLKDCLDVLE
jgi:prepilin-type N-terminal cleavage/methylation domain-containing protein